LFSFSGSFEKKFRISGCVVDYSEVIHKRVSGKLARHFKRKLLNSAYGALPPLRARPYRSVETLRHPRPEFFSSLF
jgi:hypothetical protein